jgi:hypothetical protein
VAAKEEGVAAAAVGVFAWGVTCSASGVRAAGVGVLGCDSWPSTARGVPLEDLAGVCAAGESLARSRAAPST